MIWVGAAGQRLDLIQIHCLTIRSDMESSRSWDVHPSLHPTFDPLQRFCTQPRPGPRAEARPIPLGLGPHPRDPARSSQRTEQSQHGRQQDHAPGLMSRSERDGDEHEQGGDPHRDLKQAGAEGDFTPLDGIRWQGSTERRRRKSSWPGRFATPTISTMLF
jgi:hypothetical protein